MPRSPLHRPLYRAAELAGLPAETGGVETEARLNEVSTLLTHVQQLQAVNTDRVPPTYVFPPPLATPVAETKTTGEPTEDPARLRALFIREDRGSLVVPPPKAGDRRG